MKAGKCLESRAPTLSPAPSLPPVPTTEPLPVVTPNPTRRPTPRPVQPTIKVSLSFIEIERM